MPTGVPLDHHRLRARRIARRFPPAFAGRQVDVEQVDLVVGRADLAGRIDHEGAIGEQAVVAPDGEAAEMHPHAVRVPPPRAPGQGPDRPPPARRLPAARARSRSSSPLISGVNSIAAPPSRACRTASTSACAVALAGRSRSAPEAARSGSCGEKRVEPSVALQREQVVAAADVAPVDEDLRHRHPARTLDHLVPLGTAAIEIVDRRASRPWREAALRRGRSKGRST